MSYLSIYIELSLNVVGIVLGTILLFRARDNRLMFLWGIFTLIIMVLTAHVNIESLLGTAESTVHRAASLMRIGLLLKTLFVGILATMFPIISLRPGFVTTSRLILMLSPFILALVVVRCFYWFDGAPTPLHSAADIVAQIWRPDVQMRVMILVLTLVMVVFNLTYPFVNKWIALRRRMSRGMYFYAIAVAATAVLYVFYVATADVISFYVYTYTMLIVPIAISIIYLTNENPLSLPISDKMVEQHTDGNVKEYTVVDQDAKRLYEQMELIMIGDTLYVDPSYSIEQLALRMDVSSGAIIRAIRERGFSGFLEYLTFLRIEHFKSLAVKFPGLSISELMYGSGFTSRSSFYRRFAQQESMSPKEYIEKKL